MIFEVTELLKFWTEKIVEIDPTERERPSLGLLLEKVARSSAYLVLTRRWG